MSMYGKATKPKDQPRVKPHVKKGDTVVVLAGKDRGKQGKVLRVDPVKGKAIVERVNFNQEAHASEFGIKNPMAVPKIEKVVLNMGLGEAISNAKILDSAVDELATITGQKPVITPAKKSIAAFKLREGMPIGTMVTLRGERCTSSSTG
jgi:ribosomal protein L5